VDLKDIKAIVDLMKKNSISEFELERQDFKIKLRRGPNGTLPPATPEEPPAMAYVVRRLPLRHPRYPPGSHDACPGDC